MKFIKYLFIGIFLGITFTKSEIISWFRIYEMFKFGSFHMYGVIGSAVIFGMLFIQIIKRFSVNSFRGEPIDLIPKAPGFSRYMAGGIIFGMGWAMTGACPGPMFVLVGNGSLVLMVVIGAALLGTYTYGLVKHRLPH